MGVGVGVVVGVRVGVGLGLGLGLALGRALLAAIWSLQAAGSSEAAPLHPWPPPPIAPPTLDCASILPHAPCSSCLVRVARLRAGVGVGVGVGVGLGLGLGLGLG